MIGIDQKKGIFNSKIVLSWLVSYLIVFTLPIISNLYIYHKAENSIEKSIYDSDNRMLESLQLSMDETVSGLSLLVMNLQSNESLNSMLYVTKDTPENKYIPTVIKLARNLTVLSRSYSKNISDVYVYFPNLDMGVSANYYNNSSDFFDYYYKDTNQNYTQWYEMMCKQNYATYRIVRLKEGIDAIDFVYSIPLSSSDFSASIVIRINQSNFHDIINKYVGFENKNLYILDSNNNFILKYGENPVTQMNYTDFPDEVYKMQKNGMVIISRTSEMNRWKYISVTPYKYIKKQLTYLRFLIIINYLICILLGGALVYYFVLKNYKPINNLINICKNTTLQSSYKDEYALIKDILQDYIDTKRQYKTVQYSQESTLKTQLLENLLKGRLEEYGNIEKEFGKFDIKFISDYFAVIIFKMTNFEVIFEDDENMDFVEKANMMRFIMTNVIEELAARYHKGHVTEVDGRIVCIMSFDKNNMSSWRKDMEDIIAEAKIFIESNFAFSFTASMSNIHHHLTGIANAYDEAQQTLKYRSLLKNNDIVFFDDINKGETNFIFPKEKELQLINFIRLGNYKTTETIVDSMIDTLMGSADLDYARILILNINNAILKAISESNNAKPNDINYTEIFHYIEQLTNFQNAEEYKQTLHELLHLVCNIETTRAFVIENERKEKSNDKSNDELVQKIKEYIAKNHTNNSLNIASIGDYFDITPYYASNLFKKVEGMSMLDYIGRYRVNAAKEIIRSENLVLANVANEVGFNNVRTFMRAFVKYEGITPGQFKEMVEHEQNQAQQNQ